MNESVNLSDGGTYNLLYYKLECYRRVTYRPTHTITAHSLYTHLHILGLDRYVIDFNVQTKNAVTAVTVGNLFFVQFGTNGRIGLSVPAWRRAVLAQRGATGTVSMAALPGLTASVKGRQTKRIPACTLPVTVGPVFTIFNNSSPSLNSVAYIPSVFVPLPSALYSQKPQPLVTVPPLKAPASQKPHAASCYGSPT